MKPKFILAGGPDSLCEELNRLFSARGNLNTACKVRYIVSQRSGDPRFYRGTEEDSSEFMDALLNSLAVELEENLEGISILEKFWGREVTKRKFRSNR